MKGWSLCIVIAASLLLQSCAEKNPGSTNIEQFAGEWDIMIKKLPRVGDQSLDATFVIQDTILVGSFVDSENNNIKFDKIDVEGNEMVCSYVWDGHKVNFSLASESNSPDSLSGRFMKFFSVDAVRKIN